MLVRSVSGATLTACGRLACNWGSSCLILSTVAMTLAPGWRWMLRMTAGVSSAQAPSLVFSGASTTSATSDRRTGAPLR